MIGVDVAYGGFGIGSTIGTGLLVGTITIAEYFDVMPDNFHIFGITPGEFSAGLDFKKRQDEYAIDLTQYYKSLEEIKQQRLTYEDSDDSFEREKAEIINESLYLQDNQMKQDIGNETGGGNVLNYSYYSDYTEMKWGGLNVEFSSFIYPEDACFEGPLMAVNDPRFVDRKDDLGIYNVNDGTVTDIIKKNGSYGLTIFVEYIDGYIGQYSHLSKSEVKKGDFVRGGQLIGIMGNSSYIKGKDRYPAFSTHLHLSLYNSGTSSFYWGNAIDPENYIKSHHWPTNTLATGKYGGYTPIKSLKNGHEGMDFSGWRMINGWENGLYNGFWKHTTYK